MDGTWGALLLAQLEFYWDAHLWRRLDGLTDDEYFWMPLEGAWSRPLAVEGAPFTTLEWRLMHVAVGIFGTRASTFFGDGSVPDDADMFDPRHEPPALPSSAAAALALLEHNYRWWRDGIAGLTDEQLLAPLGPRGAAYAEDPMAALVLHLNRETMHHGGEIGVLRDLYRSAGARSRTDGLRVG